MTDVAVIGGGIAGCATAALLAEAGAAVRLYEREAIAAGASGRNSGLLQHPMDAALVPLYDASLELYATLGHGFTAPGEPVGVLVLAPDGERLAVDHARAAASFPELAPEWLEGAALVAAEPALAPGLFAYRLETGRPVPPAAATKAWADRAQAAGARIEIGEEATLAVHDGRAAGVLVGDRVQPAGAVVIAAGPWTPQAIGSAQEATVSGPVPRAEASSDAARSPPIGPLWGVVAQVRLERPPRHALESAGVETLTAPGGAPDKIFSLVTAGGASAVGSTFTRERPDATAVAPGLLETGARFVPALRDARIEAVRACARPLSADGRPLLGPVPDIEGVHLAAGHGAWGISLGPGSARLVADALLGDEGIPPELAAARFGPLA
jgi:D-hydroxyproline dehydrogenase subunit beta